MSLFADATPVMTWQYVVLEGIKLLFGFAATAFTAWIAIKQQPQQARAIEENTKHTVETKEAITASVAITAEQFDVMSSQIKESKQPEILVINTTPARPSQAETKIGGE